eukprot:5989845-Amphidinium_carterae.1
MGSECLTSCSYLVLAYFERCNHFVLVPLMRLEHCNRSAHCSNRGVDCVSCVWRMVRHSMGG